MASNLEFHFVDADLLPDFPFTFELEDDKGKVTGPDALSNYSSIQIRLRRDDGTLIIRDHTVVDGPNGKGTFEWLAGDIINGIHEAEIRRIRASDAKPETIPDDEPRSQWRR